MARRLRVGVGSLGQWPREWSVVVEGDEGPEGRIGRDYVGRDDNVVEAISEMGSGMVNAKI